MKPEEAYGVQIAWLKKEKCFTASSAQYKGFSAQGGSRAEAVGALEGIISKEINCLGASPEE